MPSGDWCACTGADDALDTDERMARWNAGHSARWNRVRTAMRRAYAGVEFMRGIEVQQRGAIHDHAMLWSPTPVDRRTVKRLAMAAGFGHSVDLAPLEPGSKRAAQYVAKRVAGYVTKATDAREDVPWWGEVVSFETGEVTEAIIPARYRTWSCSRGWGLSMAAVRAECAAFVKAQMAPPNVTDALAVITAAFGELKAVPDESPPSPS